MKTISTKGKQCRAALLRNNYAACYFNSVFEMACVNRAAVKKVFYKIIFLN